MKKLFLLVLAFGPFAAGAQVQLGVKGGLTLSNLHLSPPVAEESLRMKPGINVGGLVYVPLSTHFGLQPELIYSGQGSKVKNSIENTTDNMQYINVPILLQYKVDCGFFAELGMQGGWLLSARKKVHSSSLPPGDPAFDQEGDNKDIKKYYTSTDLSGVAGIGYLSRLHIGADLRYTLGLTRLNKPYSVSIDGIPFLNDNNSTLKNNVIQFDLFYTFGRSKK